MNISSVFVRVAVLSVANNYGRTLLDNAWTDGQTDILSLVAWGGVGKMVEAAEHFQAAKKLIDETGYERRRKELRDNC